MYNRYMQGDTYDAIRRWLVPMNLGTMRTHKSVSDFLDAGFGAGVIVHHSPDCPVRHPGGKANVSCKNKVREPGAHRGVISEAEYDEYLAERARRRFVPPRLKAPHTAFAGIVWCANCGNRFVHHRRKSGASQYRCGNATFCESPSSIARTKLEALALAWLAPMASDINLAGAGRKGPSPVEAVERDRLARVALEADSALAQLAIDFARRIIPEGAYLAARDSLTAERAASNRVAALSNIQQSSRRNSVMALDLLAAWPEMTDPERNRILKELMVIHVPRSEQSPTVTFYESWDAPNLKSDHRPSR